MSNAARSLRDAPLEVPPEGTRAQSGAPTAMVRLRSLLLAALLCAVPRAGFGQEWTPIVLPDGIDYIKAAGNATRSGALALWGTRAPISDSSGTVVHRPWVMFTSSDAGEHWTAIDSSRFTSVITQSLTLYTTWYELVFSGTLLARSTVEFESPDLSTYTLERRDSTDGFRAIGFPGSVGQDTATPRVYAAGNGTLYNIRFALGQRQDSTRWSLFANTGTDAWRIIPDSASGIHRTARPVCLSFRPDAQNSLLLGTVAGVASSANGGSTWSPIATGSVLDSSTVSFVSVHPRRENYQFAVARQMSGDGMTHLYRSTDFGVSWDDVFADSVITGLGHAASDESRIVIVTQRGLLGSSDTGRTWLGMHGNLPGPYGVDAIQWLHVDPGDAGRVFAGTARSLFRLLRWPTDVPPLPGERISFSAAVFPNPMARGTTPFLSIEAAAPESCSVSIRDLLGRLVCQPTSFGLPSGRRVSALNDTGIRDLPPGMYFLSLQTPSRHTSIPLVIVR